MRLFVCTSLFLLFFQHSVRKTVEDVDEGWGLGASLRKIWVKLTGSFSRKKYTIWHNFFHLGKGLNEELNFAQIPSLRISNNSMIFYNKMFDKTMQIFDHQRLPPRNFRTLTLSFK